jgi:pyruvate/2-oxoglutarate dehydrogenase complex dihydrolipoamide dehydrogenase (E3) component
MAALPLIVFDVNETLLDLTTMEPTFERIFRDKGAMRLWFANLIMYSAALTVAGCYVPFTDIGSAVMKMLADTRGIRIGDADKKELFEKFSTMPPHPEVPGALQKLRAAGFRLFTARPLTHIEALELDYLPSHLIVLGGGYVGLELAQAYRRFGSRVTVMERGPQLMSREDPDVAAEVQRILSDEGIQFLVGAETLDAHGRSGEEVILRVRASSGEEQIAGSDILVATGRVPNTAGIGLEAAGIELDGQGYISVNERLETTAPSVWAIGECAGSPQFTHVSIDDFRIIRDNLAGAQRSTRDRLVPYCMFTEPPLAHVGLSEGEAQRQGIATRVARLPMNAVRRTATTGETQGFMKVLIGGRDDRILGFTMIGAEAGEVMATVQTAMLAEMPYPRLRDAILAHPTMAEGLGSLFENVPPRSQLRSSMRTG